MTPTDAFGALLEAKAAREAVRDCIVKTIRREGVTSAEIDGLLKAHDLASSNLRIAQDAYARLNAPIPDSTTQQQESSAP